MKLERKTAQNMYYFDNTRQKKNIPADQTI